MSIDHAVTTPPTRRLGRSAIALVAGLVVAVAASYAFDAVLIALGAMLVDRSRPTFGSTGVVAVVLAYRTLSRASSPSSKAAIAMCCTFRSPTYSNAWCATTRAALAWDPARLVAQQLTATSEPPTVTRKVSLASDRARYPALRSGTFR